MQHAFDKNTKTLFSYDKDFQYQGITDNPPIGSIELDSSNEYERITGCWTGAYFLSGWSHEVLNVYSNEDSSFNLAVSSLNEKNQIQHKLITECESWKGRYVVISGAIINNPKQLKGLTDYFGDKIVFVCSFFNELPTLGCLISNNWQKPRRINFSILYSKKLENFEYIPFIDELGRDEQASIANHIIRKGIPIISQIYCSLGFHPLDNKVLSSKPLVDNPIYCFHEDKVKEYFPYENLVTISNVSSRVPIYMKPGDKFKEKFKNEEEVLVYTITENSDIFLRDLIFNIYHFGEDYFICNVFDIFFKNKLLPVFRFSSAYKPEQKWINEIIDEELSYNGDLHLDKNKV